MALLKKYKAFVLFWLGYLLFEAYLEYVWFSSAFKDSSTVQSYVRAFNGEALLLVVKIPLTHLAGFILQQYVTKTKKAIVVFISLLLIFAAGILLHRILVNEITFPHIYEQTNEHEGVFVFLNLMNSFLDLVFAAGLGFAWQQYRMQLIWKEKEKELNKQKLETELNFLKAQTNPHFLFNTLNNIYALARKNSEHTAEMIMKLSAILRYMLYETNKQRVELCKEVEVIEHYIELEKIRYNKRLKIEFKTTIDNEQEPIAPLILLPFIENAFKHGPGESRFEACIFIHLQLEKGNLLFEIENSKETDKGLAPESEGIGLKNSKRQLELTYPTRKLEIVNSFDRFKVKLLLVLN